MPEKLAGIGVGSCDACKELARDSTSKKVFYIPECASYLCEQCRARWTPKMIMAMKRGAHWMMAALGMERRG